MIDWNIQSRAHTCQACHKPFADKETFHTILYDQKAAYERLDVCEACWTTQFSCGAADRKGFVSHWVSVYSPPPAAPPEAIGKETAESLLRKLIERNDPAHVGPRFILAAMLERKRLLKVKAQVNENGSRVFIYEHPASGDLFNITDPNLRLDQLDEVQRAVANLLEHGLPPDAAEVNAVPAEPLAEAAATLTSPSGSEGRSESPADHARLAPDPPQNPALAGASLT